MCAKPWRVSIPIGAAWGGVIRQGCPWRLSAGGHDCDRDDAVRCAGNVLSAVGLYGVTAYMAEQRTGAIGVRMALGGDRGRVLRMVLRGAFSQVAIGLAIAFPPRFGAGKLMTQQLFSVRPWDPVMLASATLALGLAALLASALPAWRAAGVEPMVALRNE